MHAPSLPPTPPSLVTRLLFWLVLRVLPNKVEIYQHHRSVLKNAGFFFEFVCCSLIAHD